jgi:FkbM family methyltransferase
MRPASNITQYTAGRIQMISMFKRLVINFLKARGYHIVWSNPSRMTTGFSFEHDLRHVVDLANPVCFDIGANEGQTIHLFSRIFDEPCIHAFEPTPRCFNRLSEQFRHHNTQLYQLAMGDCPGVLHLNEYSHSTLNSFLVLSPGAENPYNELRRTATVRVPVTTVDAFLMEKNIQLVNLLKIDTQGYDLKVLNGAINSLSSGRILNVLVELNFLEMYTGQAPATEIMQFLAAHQLYLVDIYEKEFRQGVLGWCTGLFTNRKPNHPTP